MPHIKTLDIINLKNVYEGLPIDPGTILSETENPNELIENGFCWTENHKPIVSYNLRDNISYISKKDDLLYDMHYKETAIRKNPCEDYLCRYLEEHWNIYKWKQDLLLIIIITEKYWIYKNPI